MKLVKLVPGMKDKYRFGLNGLETNDYIIHSDTIYSTIINNYVKLYGEEDLEKGIKEISNLIISSAFPFIKEIYLVTKPYCGIGKKDYEEDQQRKKKIKKIRFISLKALIKHNNDELILNEDNIFDEMIILTQEEKQELQNKKIFYANIETKNSKNIEETKLFTVNYYRMNEQAGFYFLLNDQGISEKISEKILASIRLIQDEGIGGKIRNGAGLFKKVIITSPPKEFNELMNAKENLMSLSLVLPEEAEFNKVVYYSLIERKGYIYSTNKKTHVKKKTLMIREGSIMKEIIQGKIINVAPETFEHPVYRYGKFIGIKVRYD